jgi:hypothetical protein
MFALDTTIDAVRTAKKTFVNTVFANHEAVAKALNEFVDAQSEYTKKAVKAGTDTATKLTSEAVKLGQEAAKFDYTKVAENFSKAFTVKK